MLSKQDGSSRYPESNQKNCAKAHIKQNLKMPLRSAAFGTFGSYRPSNKPGPSVKACLSQNSACRVITRITAEGMREIHSSAMLSGTCVGRPPFQHDTPRLYFSQVLTKMKSSCDIGLFLPVDYTNRPSCIISYRHMHAELVEVTESLSRQKI